MTTNEAIKAIIKVLRTARPNRSATLGETPRLLLDEVLLAEIENALDKHYAEPVCDDHEITPGHRDGCECHFCLPVEY
jgi:hypothetical protein